MKVLIADDDPAIRRGLTAQIQADGFETVACGDGDEALSILIGADAPPIAILDWMMPNLTGPDVCEAVRNTALGLTPYIIILTARIGSEDIAKALDRGADDYVTKPFSLVELRARVRVGQRIVKLQQDNKDQLVRADAASQEADLLRRLLPICVSCHRICDDDACRQELREYLQAHSEIRGGNSMCSDCAAKQGPSCTEESGGRDATK